MDALHFIRPGFFFLLIPLCIYLIWMIFFRGSQHSGYSFIDTPLQEHVLLSSGQKQNRTQLTPLLLAIAGIIITTALAGPSFEKIAQPVFKQQDSLVLLIDLSASMNSQDISPSRLIRAKQKLNDILSLRVGNQTALIAYAADAYVVTPLTDDIKTITTHLPNLSSDAINRQGSRMDRAIEASIKLFEQTSVSHGHIVALTDGAKLDTPLKAALNQLSEAGHSLSVIAFASSDGGPIPKANGGFITDSNGNIVLTKLDAKVLKKAASLGKGKYSEMTLDNTDIERTLLKQSFNSTKVASEKNNDQWKDLGGYLTLLLIPLLLLCFRKGALMVLPLSLMLFHEPSQALDWKTWFLNDNQQAYQNYQNENYSKAKEKFTLPEWQASSDYQLEQYEDSLEQWTTDDSDHLYNRGNAYTKMGKLQEAVEAYQNSLKLNPENEDAQFNLDLVKKALQQQSSQQDSDSSQNQEQQDSENSESSNNNNQENQQSSQQTDQSEQQNSEKNSDQNENQQSQSEDNAGNGESQNPLSEEEKNTDEKAAEDLKQALRDAQESQEPTQDPSQPLSPQEQLAQEQAIQQKQWLNRIEDNPGGLLRRKFKYQDRTKKQQQEPKPW